MTWALIVAKIKELLTNKYVLVGIITFVVTSFIWWRLGSTVRRMAVNRAWRQCERQCIEKGGTIEPRKRILPFFRGDTEEPLTAVESIFDDGDGAEEKPGWLQAIGPVRGIAIAGLICCACVFLWSRRSAEPTSVAASADVDQRKAAIKLLWRTRDSGGTADPTLAELWKGVMDEELQAG